MMYSSNRTNALCRSIGRLKVEDELVRRSTDSLVECCIVNHRTVIRRLHETGCAIDVVELGDETTEGTIGSLNHTIRCRIIRRRATDLNIIIAAELHNDVCNELSAVIGLQSERR